MLIILSGGWSRWNSSFVVLLVIIYHSSILSTAVSCGPFILQCLLLCVYFYDFSMYVMCVMNGLNAIDRLF